ncbi:MAG: radical SAM family heme chaperone HemW [Robiginitomaculum sp.]
MSLTSLDTIGLYVHWPYCARICPYCDFNIYKNKSASDEPAALARAIIKDLSHSRKMSGPRTLTSIHFGGGTPSLMHAEQVAEIIETARTLWDAAPNIEIALEANPADADAAKWEALARAGINRLSLGVQSFDDNALKHLGRDHDGGSARAALSLAAAIFPRVSADIIFGHKGQTKALLERDLSALIDSAAGHISAYQLTIESATAFGKAAMRGDIKAVSSDDSAALYEHVQTRLSAAGFDNYEVSNYARAGQESAHNLLYWQGGDYIGVGPGAHGRLTTNGKRTATITHLKPSHYIDAVQNNGHGIDSEDSLSAQDWAAEYLMMGLRITKGISLRRYAQINGAALDEAVMGDLIAMNLLRRQGDTLRATQDGRMVLDTVSLQLLTAKA